MVKKVNPIKGLDNTDIAIAKQYLTYMESKESQAQHYQVLLPPIGREVVPHNQADYLIGKTYMDWKAVTKGQK